ncbi:hypothetical protein, partial [Serratia liquefaciens]|uniref:hypothetical protein n=1 Tax=Serratia liquefaciens TaxID=614 RepID=UPI0023614C88
MQLISLMPLLPEIAIAVGAMALLMLGAALEVSPLKSGTHEPNARQGLLVGWLAVLLLVGV